MRLEKGKIIDVPTPLLITFGVLWLIGACWGIYHEIHKDTDLKDSDRLDQIQTEFENDFKKIQLPTKTTVNSTQPVGKPGYGITVTTRYRTELPQEEFENYFEKELKKLGWTYNGRDEFSGIEKKWKFRKGKYNALLTLESYNYLTSDKADYYQLSFRFTDDLSN